MGNETSSVISNNSQYIDPFAGLMGGKVLNEITQPLSTETNTKTTTNTTEIISKPILYDTGTFYASIEKPITQAVFIEPPQPDIKPHPIYKAQEMPTPQAVTPPEQQPTTTIINNHYFTTQSTYQPAQDYTSDIVKLRLQNDNITSTLNQFKTDTTTNFDNLRNQQTLITSLLSQNGTDLKALKYELSNTNTKLTSMNQSIFDVLTKQNEFEKFAKNEFTNVKTQFTNDINNLSNNIKTQNNSISNKLEDYNKNIMNVMANNQTILLSAINDIKPVNSFFRNTNLVNSEYDLMFRSNKTSNIKNF